MRYRITFSGSVFVDAATISGARAQFDFMPLFSNDAENNHDAEYNGLLEVTDEDNNDVKSEFNAS